MEKIEELEKEITELRHNIEIYDSYAALASKVAAKRATKDEREKVDKFCTVERIRDRKYTKIASTINDRITTMRLRLSLVERYISIESNYIGAKTRKLVASGEIKKIKEKAAEDSHGDSKEYNRRLQELISKKELSEEEQERYNESINKVKKEEKALIKKNEISKGLKNKIANFFIRIGNSQRKIHNANARFQNEHPKLNAIIKFLLPLLGFVGLTVASVLASGVIPVLPVFTGIGAVASLIIGEYNFGKHVIFGNKLRERELWNLRDTSSLSEVAFKSRKMNGNSEINTKDTSYRREESYVISSAIREAMGEERVVRDLRRESIVVPEATRRVVPDGTPVEETEKPKTEEAPAKATETPARVEAKPKSKRASTSVGSIAADMREKLALCKNYQEKLDVVGDVLHVFEVYGLDTREEFLERRNAMKLMDTVIHSIDLTTMSETTSLAALRANISFLGSRINQQMAKDQLDYKKIMADVKTEKRSEGEVRK